MPLSDQKLNAPDRGIEVLEPTFTLSLIGSLRANATELRPAAWHALLENLWQHEALELVHRFRPEAVDGSRYSFDVRLLQSLVARASQSRQVLQVALAGAVPRWQFVATETAPDNGPDLPLRATLAPAPLRLTHAGNGRHVDRAGGEQYMPFPAELPQWFLTTPFDEPIISGHWAMEMRFARCSPSAVERERLHCLLQDLRRGSLRLHRPQMALEPYLHDVDLDARAQGLLRAWLASATGGYCMTVAEAM